MQICFPSHAVSEDGEVCAGGAAIAATLCRSHSLPWADVRPFSCFGLWLCLAVVSQPIAIDTVVLLLQLLCQQRGWRYKVGPCSLSVHDDAPLCRYVRVTTAVLGYAPPQVLGRWPAKLYLVMDVPNVIECLTVDVHGCFLKAGIAGWSFPDGATSPYVELKVRLPVLLPLLRSQAASCFFIY